MSASLWNLIETIATITGVLMGLTMVVGFAAILIVADRKARRDESDLRTHGVDGFVRVLSVANATLPEGGGSRFIADCELEFVPAAEYRSAALSLPKRRLGVPILWMPRFQPGIVLRARVHPDLQRMELHLEDRAKVELVP